MTQEQPEALEIADDLSAMGMPSDIAGRGADTIRRLHAENEALRKNKEYAELILQVSCNHEALKALHKDAERLDWLVEHRAYVVSDPDACPGYWLHFIHKETHKVWVQGDEHPSPRAAIDAAMKGQS